MNNNTPFKAIIFDFGGVLLRTHTRTPRTDWDDKLGLPHGTFENYIFNGPVGRLAQVGQATWQDIWINAAQKFNLTPQQMTVAQETFFSGDKLDYNLADYIRRLKKQYTIGLLSNTWYPDGWTLLLQYSIADAFHFVVTSAEVGVMKPDPKIYQVALERATVKPNQAIFVDDFQLNIEAAQQLGMEVVYFVDSEAALTRLADLTSNSQYEKGMRE